MIQGSLCVAVVVCGKACGGHCSTFPFICCFSSLHLHFFLALSPHFLSSFCSVTLSLLTLSLFLSHTNALSHHCLSSLSFCLSLTLFLKFLLLLLHYFTFCGHPFSLLHSFFLVSPSCSFLLSVCHFLLDFYSILKPRLSPFPSHPHEMILLGISGLTFFLLHLFVIHCICTLQRGIINMAIYTRALSGCC